MTNPLVFGACAQRCGGIARRDYGTGLTLCLSVRVKSACGVAHDPRMRRVGFYFLSFFNPFFFYNDLSAAAAPPRHRADVHPPAPPPPPSIDDHRPSIVDRRIESSPSRVESSRVESSRVESCGAVRCGVVSCRSSLARARGEEGGRRARRTRSAPSSASSG